VTRQRIPSFDRRNDRQLGAATAAMPEVAGKPERPAQPHRGEHKPKRNRNHAPAKTEAHHHRHEAGPGRAEPAGGKPPFKGPRRGRGGGGGGRPGVWSNR
jgi:ATP-dependent RNA helicase RhlE